MNFFSFSYQTNNYLLIIIFKILIIYLSLFNLKPTILSNYLYAFNFVNPAVTYDNTDR